MAFDCNGYPLPAKFLHSRDVAQDETERRARRKARAWADDGSAGDRVYDALLGVTGYENRVTPTIQAIRWDKQLKRWVPAVTQSSNSAPVTLAGYSQKPGERPTRLIKASTLAVNKAPAPQAASAAKASDVGTNRHRGGNF